MRTIDFRDPDQSKRHEVGLYSTKSDHFITPGRHIYINPDFDDVCEAYHVKKTEQVEDFPEKGFEYYIYLYDVLPRYPDAKLLWYVDRVLATTGKRARVFFPEEVPGLGKILDDLRIKDFADVKTFSTGGGETHPITNETALMLRYNANNDMRISFFVLNIGDRHK